MPADASPARKPGSALAACCTAHAVQDGLVALQFVLLPVIAQALGLSYAQVGLLRTIGGAALAALEIPSGFVAERLGERRLLAAGLIGAGVGYIGIAYASGFVAMAVCFAVAGMGAGLQHALSSAVLVRTYDGAPRRRALGAYNAAGDAGKLAYTALFGLGVGAGIGWNAVVIALAVAALIAAVGAWRALRGTDAPHDAGVGEGAPAPRGFGIRNARAFAGLGTAVFLDSTVQTVFLTFIAFLAAEKGLGAAGASAAVVVALIGGMCGKFACGFLAARVGDRMTFVLLQGLTVLGIVAVVSVPGAWLLGLLPFVGLVVQGSSTVTYGAVADHAHEGRQARAYALVYTIANGAAVTGPLAFGLLADARGLDAAFYGLALLAGLTLPFAPVLQGRLQGAESKGADAVAGAGR